MLGRPIVGHILLPEIINSHITMKILYYFDDQMTENDIVILYFSAEWCFGFQDCCALE